MQIPFVTALINFVKRCFQAARDDPKAAACMLVGIVIGIILDKLYIYAAFSRVETAILDGPSFVLASPAVMNFLGSSCVVTAVDKGLDARIESYNEIVIPNLVAVTKHIARAVPQQRETLLLAADAQV